jgi:hypothetical protein
LGCNPKHRLPEGTATHQGTPGFKTRVFQDAIHQTAAKLRHHQDAKVAVADTGENVLPDQRLNSEALVVQGRFGRLAGCRQANGRDQEQAYPVHGLVLSIGVFHPQAQSPLGDAYPLFAARPRGFERLVQRSL